MSYHPQAASELIMDSNPGMATAYPSSGRAIHGHTLLPSAEPTQLINQFPGLTFGGMNNSGNNIPLSLGNGPAYVMGSDGHFAFAPMSNSQTMNLGHLNGNQFANYPPTAGGYGVPYVGFPVPLFPFTPGRIPNHPRADRSHGDVPGLENRRGSYSTTESAPATPSYNGMAPREGGPQVAGLSRSTYTTPSPQQLGLAHLHNEQQVPKPIVAAISDQALEDVLNKEPAVPKAVPAVFTPVGQMKSLEQSLENRIHGNRNVYIRGLHPTTDDELLYRFASRFGRVETSKAIIDTGTGACKGFGFAKFLDVRDSEMCIRGFHHLGYEVGFARESFNSRLKAEGDEGSTNLYISNLPKSLTEVELGTIFLSYTILSSKILRDSMGNSRGVGFARFENRDICDEVIRKFNGVGIGEEGLLMNIRFADTPAQKELKRVTAERRQFRTNEYNIGAYGTPLVGMSPALYGQHMQWRRAIPSSRSREDEAFLGHTGSQRGQSQPSTTPEPDTSVDTPNSSECDEGVTIHADPEGRELRVNAESSPSAKKCIAVGQSE